MFTKQQLSPHALELFRRVKSKLPPEIALRLRCNRGFVTHPCYRTLFLFDVWDCNQTDVLDHRQFKYCLGYDQRPQRVKDGYFHLWLTRIRIYREREAIVATLDEKLPKAVPRGFRWIPCDRAFNIACDFDYPKNPSDLPDLLLPLYVRLIAAVHPILMPIVDRFTTPLAEGERRAVVAKRGRLAYTATGVHDRKRVREYTRSIPPSWRPILLKKYDYRCALCECDLRSVRCHIDHIKPFSKGGATTHDNLQPLCEPCNLVKGNREP